MATYDRQTTELTLDLERIDHKVQLCYQRRMQLAKLIEIERKSVTLVSA